MRRRRRRRWRGEEEEVLLFFIRFIIFFFVRLDSPSLSSFPLPRRLRSGGREQTTERGFGSAAQFTPDRICPSTVGITPIILLLLKPQEEDIFISCPLASCASDWRSTLVYLNHTIERLPNRAGYSARPVLSPCHSLEPVEISARRHRLIFGPGLP